MLFWSYATRRQIRAVIYHLSTLSATFGQKGMSAEKPRYCMKFLWLLLLLPLLNISCQKDQPNDKQTCYMGRYVGEGCWPVVQVLKPLDGSIPTGLYGSYEHSVGTGILPEKYKDGKPFYFTINQIDSNSIYLTYCIPTKYLIAISSFSDSACNASGN